MFFIKPVIIFVLNWEMQAQSTVTHTRARTLLVLLRDITALSPTTCISMAYMLFLFKNILCTTHVYFLSCPLLAPSLTYRTDPSHPKFHINCLFRLAKFVPKRHLKPQALCYSFLARYFLLRYVTRRLELGTLLVMKCGCGTSCA